MAHSAVYSRSGSPKACSSSARTASTSRVNPFQSDPMLYVAEGAVGQEAHRVGQAVFFIREAMVVPAQRYLKLDG